MECGPLNSWIDRISGTSSVGTVSKTMYKVPCFVLHTESIEAHWKFEVVRVQTLNYFRARQLFETTALARACFRKFWLRPRDARVNILVCFFVFKKEKKKTVLCLSPLNPPLPL